MHRALLLTGTLALSLALPALEAGSKKNEAKEALQALQEYIGGWKGNGTSDKNKSEIWKETASWNWRFKGKEVYLSVDMDHSKTFKSGEIRFLTDKEAYQLVLIDKKDQKMTFEGKLKKETLTLDYDDPKTMETHRIKINPAGGGIRMVLNYEIKPENRNFFVKQFQIGYTKEGESLGATGKKGPECVVTGGLGTMAVSYMGVTYYVCCSGCRDAFNENPAKIIAEYNARKKKGG